MAVRADELALGHLIDHPTPGRTPRYQGGHRVHLVASDVVEVEPTRPLSPTTITTAKPHLQGVEPVLPDQATSPRRRKSSAVAQLARALHLRLPAMAASTPTLTPRKLGKDPRLRCAELDHPRHVVGLCFRVDVVRINDPHVGLAAVDASAHFPCVHDRLEPASRSLEVASGSNTLTPLTLPGQGLHAIVGIRPSSLVATPRGIPTRLSLALTRQRNLADGCSAREPAGFDVEGPSWMLRLASRAP